MRPPAFWSIAEGRDAAPMLRLLLTPPSWLWAQVTARRIARAAPVRAGVPVVSIGNLTLGGTGKTPLARLVRTRLAALAEGPVCIVSRGHGGRLEGPVLVDPTMHTAHDVGDEPLMLARDGPVIVSRDRAAGAALAEASGHRAIVLDDGHQNPALSKALSIVVVDGQTGFGNGRVCPAGPLREPVAAGLARADGVIWMGGDPGEARDRLPGFGGPVLAASLVAEPFTHEGPVLGFCGIGRPEKFDTTLRSLGLQVEDMLPFPDHHVYRPRELAALAARAAATGARLVTTEKDMARLPPDFAQAVYVVRVAARMSDPAALDALLVNALEAHHGG
jgi:tetraacyldisaccharide 4'-kinase